MISDITQDSKTSDTSLKLVSKVEIILYLKGKPISIQELCEISNADEIKIKESISELVSKYNNTDSALNIVTNKNRISLEINPSLSSFVEDMLPVDLSKATLRTLATIAIKKKILQSDLVLIRGSGAYDHIKELLDKNFISRKRQKDGRSYWIRLSENFFKTFSVTPDFLSKQNLS